MARRNFSRPGPRIRPDPMLRWIRVAVALLVLVFVALVVVGYVVLRGAGSESAEPAAAETVTETVAETVEEAETPIPPPPDPSPEPTDTKSPPTATPEPSPTPEADMRLGVAERSIDCEFFTAAIAYVMERDLGLTVQTVGYESADDLFTGLADGEVDVTLCFVDPDDRPQIRGEDGERVGYIRQIGAHYWDSGEGKLQIWGNGAAKADLREDQPCILTILENIDIEAEEIATDDPQEWVNANRSQIRRWITCTPNQ